MPVKSEIDAKNNVIIRKVIGELTLQDVKDALASTPQLDGYTPSMGAVWDYSEGTIEKFYSNELTKLAQFIKQWSQGRGGIDYRVAAFAPRDIDFGLSRIYQTLIEIHGIPFEFSVFRDLDQAIRWVNKIEPEENINVPWLRAFSPKRNPPQNT
jgi:hypothetical protein